MSARVTFDLEQVDSLPAVLCMIHRTLQSLDDNATANAHAVDWATVRIETRISGDALIATADATYIPNPSATKTEYGIGVNGDPGHIAEDQVFYDRAAALAEVQPLIASESVYERTVSPWKQVSA